MIYFITGNKGKFEEASNLIPNLKQLNIDLPEIQELDSKKIIEEKLKEALRNHQGEFIVDDTSLNLECLNGFPGPLIKWLLKSIGSQGIYELCKKYDDFNVTARTIVGYTDGQSIKFFEGVLKGIIVKPSGSDGFGWDPVFKPDGFNVTLAEMSVEERNKIKMRGQALRKLKNHLASKQ